MRISLRLISVLLCLSILLGKLARNSYAQGLTDQQVKAAFVYNFLKLAELSKVSAGKSLSICLFGFVNSVDILMVLRGKSVGTKSLVVIENPKSATQVCDVAYFRAGASVGSDRLSRFVGAGVLTVGEDPDFLERGGVVKFFLEENKVHFGINVANAENEGIRFSSKLLALARISGK